MLDDEAMDWLRGAPAYVISDIIDKQRCTGKCVYHKNPKGFHVTIREMILYGRYCDLCGYLEITFKAPKRCAKCLDAYFECKRCKKRGIILAKIVIHPSENKYHKLSQERLLTIPTLSQTSTFLKAHPSKAADVFSFKNMPDHATQARAAINC